MESTKKIGIRHPNWRISDSSDTTAGRKLRPMIRKAGIPIENTSGSCENSPRSVPGSSSKQMTPISIKSMENKTDSFKIVWHRLYFLAA